MSITDELRHEVANYPFRDNRDFALFEAIADRIDTEHEKAMSRAGQLLADVESDRNCYYVNWQDCKQKVLQGNITFDELNARIESLEDELSHCIELPKDADGEYIHIGDVMVSKDGKLHKVDSLTRNPIGSDPEWFIGLVLLNDGVGVGSLVRYRPDTLRHHSPDTWERIIEDAREYMLNIGGSYLWKNKSDELVARCKALAGDGTGGSNEHH